MGFFDFLKPANINAGVTEYQQTEGAALLDVRTDGEYRSGHVAGSINIPLDEIDRAAKKFPDKNQPIFVYCLSGARSSRAVSYLKRLGYTQVKNIGGISSYRGKVVR